MRSRNALITIQILLLISCVYAIFYYRSKTFRPIQDLKNQKAALSLTATTTISGINNEPAKNEPDISKASFPVGGGPPCRRNFGRIGIFMVYTRYAAYSHASNTLRCYAVSKGYEIFVVHAFDDELSKKKCGMFTDVFFRKHCVASVYLEKVDWLYVSDADTAVVNGDHCMEEFLEPQADLIFYERFFTSEITSGNYLVQNTPAGRNFLYGWATMEFERPPAPVFVSADNGFLHMQLLRVLFPEERETQLRCMNHLNESLWPNWEVGYGKFIRCCKELLMTKDSSWHARANILILPRAQAWVRDTVFTDHDLWHGDFMSHGVKQSDPFDLTMLKRLERFVNNSVPIECYSPNWRPITVSGKLKTTVEVLKKLRRSADTHEKAKLNPIFADFHFENCWPTCKPLFRNF